MLGSGWRLLRGSVGIRAACRAPGRLPRPPHGENGLGRLYRGKREVLAAGLSAWCSLPRRELLSCAGLERGGRSLVAHLLLPVPVEPRGERTRGACWRGPVPDICCQPQGPGWQKGTSVRQWSVMLEPAGCWKRAGRYQPQHLSASGSAAGAVRELLRALPA